MILGFLLRKRKWNYTVFKKKVCHYIFDDNSNKNCPIAIILGTLITQTLGHRKVVSFSPPHLVCVTILPWKTQNTKIPYIAVCSILLCEKNVLRQLVSDLSYFKPSGVTPPSIIRNVIGNHAAATVRMLFE